MKKALLCLAAALLLFTTGNPALAQNFDAVRRADGARVTPEKYLRDWDPVTVFLDQDAGPKNGGSADAPQKFATITPQPAGEWRWLGARTLQFRPAEPWTPLQCVTVASARGATKLVALLSPPSSTVPADGADPVAELTQIALTFPAPVDAAALARLISIEIRPSPGLSSSQARLLAPTDYEVLPLAREKRDAAQSYVVKFRDPIGAGRVVALRLKLADDAELADEIFELRAQTAPPFAVTDATCGRGWSDDRIAGALRCASFGDGAAPESGAEEGGDVASAYAAANKRRLTLQLFPPRPPRSTSSRRARLCASRRRSTISTPKSTTSASS